MCSACATESTGAGACAWCTRARRAGAAEPIRLAVYTDFAYRRVDGEVWAGESFAVFMAAVGRHFDGTVFVGRLDPTPARWHYRVPGHVELVALPFYRALADLRFAARTFAAALRRFWRVLDGVEAVWLLGPHPLALAFALLARARRRRVVLGVRQDLLAYARARRPGRRSLLVAAHALEGSYRALARWVPTVVVGTEMAARYRRATRLLEISVSLVPASAMASDGDPDARGRGRELLSVGRLDPEKNPLLLADVLARLVRDDPSWRLTICGEGDLRPALEERLEALGVAAHARLAGYVPVDGGLLDLYRRSDAFLHVTWTEGMPQVLVEAFASGLPVVATAVGGVPAFADGAAVLVPPGDAEAAAAAVVELAGDPERRVRLAERGLDIARRHSIERQAERVAQFIRG